MTGTNAFLVTGATGFLGGYITAELLRRGEYVIATVRPRFGMTPSQRMKAMMGYFALDPGNRLEVLEADLERPGLGLEKSVAAKLKSSVDRVFHCAADTSFAARRSRQIETANVRALNNVFQITEGCAHFYHMSTAYVSGNREGACLEQLEDPQDFFNPYERSKHEAEKMITALCAENGTRLSMYRPSVVYGDSETGRSLSFTALYYPVRTLIFLKETLKKDLLEKQGKRASHLGVRIFPGGELEMPLCFPGEAGGLNLIPIDHLVKSVMALMDQGTEGIFHIVNPRQIQVGQILEFIQQAYAIAGLSTCKTKSAGHHSPLQILIDKTMESYYPYFCDRRHFDDSRTTPVLEKAGIHCPPLDFPIFRRCMDYAIDHGWNTAGRT